MRISDWSSDVCSSDLPGEYTITVDGNGAAAGAFAFRLLDLGSAPVLALNSAVSDRISPSRDNRAYRIDVDAGDRLFIDLQQMSATADRATFRLIDPRSEERTSELQSLMRISYAVFCLKKKTTT